MSGTTASPSSGPPGPRPRVGHKNRGCLVGCGILILGGIAATIIAAYGMFFAVNRAVEKYLSHERKPFAPVALSQEAVADARARVDAFHEALMVNQAPPALMLTADEVNALLDEFAKENKIEIPARVSFADDKIHAELSIPLRGLYLNGSGTLSIGLTEGVLQIFVTELEINGEAPPSELLGNARQFNLAAGIMEDPEVRGILGKLQYVTITGGKLKITPKPAGGK